MVTSSPSHDKPKDVRILLVGEDGVGKTSLILALISEEFHQDVPARTEEITIPADVTPEKVPTHIVDYSTQEQSEAELFDELRKANAICVVYAVDDQTSIDKIVEFWLPTIQKVLGQDHGKPVILVGNRSDDEDSSTLDQVLPLMSQYSEIETCVECSAKTMKNISELFYYAQKAVLHPTGPLYTPEDKELTQICKRALVRIFKICDQDNDGLLNDYELNGFQLRCFGIPLNPDALQDIKSVVKRSIADGVMDAALTLKGFLYLHTLFIQRGRHETTWSVLRRFGYDNSLQLSPEYLFPSLKVPKGCSVELSYDGFQFLTALFEKYDEDGDGSLSPTELQNLFSVCPAQPWGPEVSNTVVTARQQGWITYQGYLAYWVLTTLLDTPRTMEYLAYLGYVTNDRNQLSALSVTRDKRVDWQRKETSRNVFQCHVVGPKDVGKTAFLQGVLGKSLRDLDGLNKKHLSPYTISTASVHGQEKYLLMHEIDVMTRDDSLSAYELSCDVVCLMYDASNSQSFEYIARIYKKHFHRTRVPCLVVGTKADRREVSQQYELQPVQFCQKYRLPPPVFFTASDMPSREVYNKLTTLAVYPHMKHVYYLHDSAAWVKFSLGAAAAALFGFVVYKNL